MPRRVAVKILHPQHAENPTVRARFKRELEAACRVQHENVVSVFDIGEDPNLGLYYVMELVRGTPLKDYLNGEPLPWPFVYRVGQQLGRALHAIHAANIVHRDLKPQNIMLVERSSLEELVKVLDFGIASLKTQDEDAGDVELTGARMVLGTPPYMSPEQTYMRSDRERLGLTVDARSDLYSLGVILYEMAAGRRPFNGDAHDIVVAHRLTRAMPLDRMVGVSVPPEFATLVMRCLEKDPKDRPQSAREFTRDLKRCEEKPVRVWSGIAEKDVQDHPTIMDDDPVPIAEALPRDTQPRLSLAEPPVPERPARPAALWGPVAAALVVLGLIALAFIPASTDGRTGSAIDETPFVAATQQAPPATVADRTRTGANRRLAGRDRRARRRRLCERREGHERRPGHPAGARHGRSAARDQHDDARGAAAVRGRRGPGEARGRSHGPEQGRRRDRERDEVELRGEGRRDGTEDHQRRRPPGGHLHGVDDAEGRRGRDRRRQQGHRARERRALRGRLPQGEDHPVDAGLQGQGREPRGRSGGRRQVDPGARGAGAARRAPGHERRWQLRQGVQGRGVFRGHVTRRPW